MFDIFISDRAEVGGGPFAVVSHDRRDDLPPDPDGGNWHYIATVDRDDATTTRLGSEGLSALVRDGYLISWRPLF
jgi:hypothetical protein